MKIPQIELNNQTKMPQLGFGTWQLEDEQDLHKALDSAWESGYRHIDTAQIYNNEYAIGKWLKSRNINLNEIYITTKVWVSNFRNEEDFKASVYESLKRLGVPKVNMILLHWALSEEVSLNAYKWLEDIKLEGLTDSIGVSNFNVERLEAVLKHARVKPTINQVQFDLVNQEEEIREYSEEHDVLVQGYSLLKPYLNCSTRGNLDDNIRVIVDEIAKKYNKSGAQLILRYAIESNLIIFPKSKTPSRILENAQVFDFKLEKADFYKLKSINNQPKEIKMDEVAHKGSFDYMLDHPLRFECKFKAKDNYWINDDSMKF